MVRQSYILGSEISLAEIGLYQYWNSGPWCEKIPEALPVPGGAGLRMCTTLTMLEWTVACSMYLAMPVTNAFRSSKFVSKLACGIRERWLLRGRSWMAGCPGSKSLPTNTTSSLCKRTVTSTLLLITPGRSRLGTGSPNDQVHSAAQMRKDTSPQLLKAKTFIAWLQSFRKHV